MSTKQFRNISFLTPLFALAFSLLAAACPLQAHADPKKIEVLVSPSGSGPYLAWATMQNYASDFSDSLQPVAVETPGFTYNVRYVASTPDKWKNTVFGSGQVVEWAALNGVKPFFPEPSENVKDFRVLGVMSQTSNLFVTLDDEIKSPEDFEEKSVAVGLLTQNEWGMHQRMMLDYWGITSNLASFDALGPSQNIDALLDGRADIGTLVVHSSLGFRNNLEPGPFKKLESSQRDWQFVSVPPEKIEGHINETGSPFMVREIPANTLTNQPDKITTFGNSMTLAAHKSFPEEDAYELVKLWLEMGPEIGKYSAVAQIWDPDTIASLAKTSPENIHPGAMRAYREAGLIE
jgi:TRAP transporter TAXI family solute receptor